MRVEQKIVLLGVPTTGLIILGMPVIPTIVVFALLWRFTFRRVS